MLSVVCLEHGQRDQSCPRLGYADPCNLDPGSPMSLNADGQCWLSLLVDGRGRYWVEVLMGAVLGFFLDPRCRGIGCHARYLRLD